MELHLSAESSEDLEDILDRTRRGDKSSVMKIITSLMHDMSQYSSRMLEAVLCNVREDILPAVTRYINDNEELPPHLLYAEDACSLALFITYMAPLGCGERPEEREATISLLRSKIHVIIPWMLLELDQRPNHLDTSKPVSPTEHSYLWVSGALRGLMDLDEELESAILANPVSLDILLVLWSAEDDGSKPLILPHQRFHIRKGGCPIVESTLRFIQETKNGDMAPLLQRCFASPKPCDAYMFTHRLFQRALLIQGMAQAKQETSNYLNLLYTNEALVKITHLLLTEHPNEFAPDIVNRCHVLLHTRNFTRLMRGRVDEDVKHSYWERNFDMILFIFESWVIDSPVMLFYNLYDSLYQGGLMESLAFMLRTTGHSPETRAKIDRMVRLLKTCMIHPKAVLTVRASIFGSMSWTPQGRQPRNVKIPLVEARNEILAVCIDRKDAYDAVPSKIPLCDNFSHTPTAARIKAMACSRCQSVVYCSKSCQKEDWKARHRFECRIDRDMYLIQCVEERRYRQKARAHHIILTTRHVLDTVAPGGSDRALPISSTTGPTVAIVDMRSYPFEMETVPFDDFVAAFQPTVSRHLRKRFDDLVVSAREMGDVDPASSFKMVQAIVPFGQELVYLTATVRLRELGNLDSGLKVVNSMVESRSTLRVKRNVIETRLSDSDLTYNLRTWLKKTLPRDEV